jgi:hypothetical protein
MWEFVDNRWVKRESHGSTSEKIVPATKPIKEYKRAIQGVMFLINDHDCCKKIRDQMIFDEMREHELFDKHAPRRPGDGRLISMKIGNFHKWWDQPCFRFTPCYLDEGKRTNIRYEHFSLRIKNNWSSDLELKLWECVVNNGIHRFNDNWKTADDKWRKCGFACVVPELANWEYSGDFTLGIREYDDSDHMDNLWGICKEDRDHIDNLYGLDMDRRRLGRYHDFNRFGFMEMDGYKHHQSFSEIKKEDIDKLTRCISCAWILGEGEECNCKSCRETIRDFRKEGQEICM